MATSAGRPAPEEAAAKAPGEADEASLEAVAACLKHPAFEGAPKRAADLLVGRCELLDLERDEVLARAGLTVGEPAFYFVISGQVSVSEFHPHDPAELKKLKKRPKKVNKPSLARLAKSNLALFGPGDFFADAFARVAEIPPGTDPTAEIPAGIAIFTLVPAQVVRIYKDEVLELCQAMPSLKRELQRRSGEGRVKLEYLQLDDQKEVMDFYVRHGLFTAKRARIRLVDKCIDCDACHQACTDRHGATRLDRVGPMIGRVSLAYACHTCVDMRCLSGCDFDSIGFDDIKKEVVITDESCTGCSMCARNCPYDSINMVDRPQSLIDAALERGDKKAANFKRLANKCDHCSGHKDMACVTQCPTGALIDIEPQQLFHVGEAMMEPVDGDREYADPRPLQGRGSLGTKLAERFLVWSGLLIVAAIAFEVAMRLWLPTASITALITGQHPTTFQPSRGLGYWLGVSGTLLMVGSMFYVLRRRLPFLKQSAELKVWLDLHVWMGLVGSSLIVFHSSLQLSRWISLAFWAMVSVVVTGLIGRYLFTQVPIREFRSEKEGKAIDQELEKISNQWKSMTVSVNVLEAFLEKQKAGGPAPTPDLEKVGTFKHLFASLAYDIGAALYLLRQRLGSFRKIRNKQLRRQAVQLAKAKLRHARQQRFLVAAKRILATWRKIHVWCTVFLWILASVHITIALLFHA
jgi:Fe-S-cluster-containing hydrogenase component 2/CRP-like cAMP-binding protein